MVANAVVSDWPSGSANTGWPQEPSGMLLPGRVEGWPAGTQRAASPAQRLLSQAVAWWDASQYRDGDRFLRNQGTGGELLDLRLGSSIAPNSNDPLFLAPEEQGYVYLPGVGGNLLTVPDEAALDITGDIDIRVRVSMDDWTPAALQNLAARYNGAAGDVSWYFSVNTNGRPRVGWADATSTIRGPLNATAAPTVNDGDTIWMRAVIDVDNGSGQAQAEFYWAADSVDVPSSWTQLGSAVVGSFGTSSIQAGSLAVTVGNRAGDQSLSGKVYRAQVLNGIGGPAVLDIDCDAITSGSATSFTAVTNQTVTINRSTSGRKSVAVPARSKGGAPVFLLGSDDFLEVQDNWQHGLLNFDAGQSFTLLAVLRTWANQADNTMVMTKRGASTAAWRLNCIGIRSNNALYGASFRDAAGTQAEASGTNNFGDMVVLTATANRPEGLWRLARTTRDAAATTSVGATPAGAVLPERVRVGAQDLGTPQYINMEFYAAAIFRRALTAGEIRTVSDYFTGRIA